VKGREESIQRDCSTTTTCRGVLIVFFAKSFTGSEFTADTNHERKNLQLPARGVILADEQLILSP
jgi:hypothetical protein